MQRVRLHSFACDAETQINDVSLLLHSTLLNAYEILTPFVTVTPTSFRTCKCKEGLKR